MNVKFNFIYALYPKLQQILVSLYMLLALYIASSHSLHLFGRKQNIKGSRLHDKLMPITYCNGLFILTYYNCIRFVIA
jgi:hypothetical protein